METYLLSIVTFLPLLAGIVLLCLPGENKKLHGLLAMGATLVTLALSIPLYFGYHANTAAADVGQQFQYFVDVPWVMHPKINYTLGIDGISLMMVLMTTLIFPFVVGVSLKSVHVRTKMFYFLVLMVETAILGVFDSLNLLLFYVFYEAMLIPLYFLVGMWGGEKRIAATMKFFLYTMVGSMLMLVSIMSLYFLTGTFDYREIQQQLPAVLHAHPNLEVWLFLGFFAAFAVKAPIWPFHSWVPDAYAEAPTGASIILVALKMGLYGFIRFNIALFPHATMICAPVIIALSVIGVIYAALIASVQPDLKRLIAYSSISHLGVVSLAIFGLSPVAISGAVLQMVSHTITITALFILAAILFERRGTYDINSYGGVWKVMPVFAALFLIATLSSVALPGTSGFAGEFTMLVGTFQTHPWATSIATTAAIWSVVYMLWMFQRVMHGPVVRDEVSKMTDVNKGDLWALVPLSALMILIGIAPQPILEKVGQPALYIVERGNIPNMHGNRDLDYLPPRPTEADIYTQVPPAASATPPIQ